MNRSFSINPKARGNPVELAVNPEGGVVYALPAELALYLNMSAFKLRNSFYWTADETLSNLESLLDRVDDTPYKLALSIFLSDMLGIRLAPVIAVTREAIRGKASDSNKFNEYIKFSTAKIMDRPDKIANSLAYAKYVANDIAILPPFYKRALKDAFEKFDPYTLKKFRLKRRSFKTADLIKILHPKPRSNAISALYKAIIENTNEASIEKGTVITEVLSDSKLTSSEKKAWVAKNVMTIPINALIKNLRNFEVTDESLKEFEHRLNKGLRVVEGMPVVKVLNPFDVLEAGVNCGNAQLTDVINRALSVFSAQLNLGVDGKSVSVLVDVSGSMGGIGIDIASKYASLLFPALSKANVNLYKFNTSLSIIKASAIYFAKNNSPALLRQIFLKEFSPHGGTALADSVRAVAKRDKPDLMIVISDEISWADERYNVVLDVGYPVIAINPIPVSNSSVFSPTKPIIRLSSLDAKIFFFIPLLSNIKTFKKWLINWAFG